MSQRRSGSDQEAIARRLRLLGDELSMLRGDLPGRPVPGQPVMDRPERGQPPTGQIPVSELTHTRIRGPAPVPDLAVDVPLPGRHAARRRGAGLTALTALTALVPETLRGRVSLGPAHLLVVVLLVLAGAGFTAWQLRSPQPSGGAAPTGVVTAPLATPTSSSSAAADVVVDVAGRVRHPGIAVLKAGSRVSDALEAAGGAKPGVDLTSLNLARVLVDGEQVLVGVEAVAVGVPGSRAPSAPPAGSAGLVNLNTADQVALESLPDVGPVTAASILSWRDEHGGFTAIEELLEVDGIGEATLAKLTPFVTI